MHRAVIGGRAESRSESDPRGPSKPENKQLGLSDRTREFGLGSVCQEASAHPARAEIDASAEKREAKESAREGVTLMSTSAQGLRSPPSTNLRTSLLSRWGSRISRSAIRPSKSGHIRRMSIQPPPRDGGATAAPLWSIIRSAGVYDHPPEVWWMLAAQFVLVIALIVLVVA